MKHLITLISFLFLSFGLQAQEAYKNPNLSPEKRAKDLLSRLTLEQKVSLMSYNSPAIPELGIKAYNWWSEALHGAARAGQATVFPQAIGMAASFDDVLLREVFDITSTEQRIKFIQSRNSAGKASQYHGLTVWTPNINIFRDPRWGRGQETYGEDPYLTTRMGRSVVLGLQGDPDQKYDKLHACLKHFAVHSGPESERHIFDVEDVSWRDLNETYLYAFENIVKTTDVQEVMCAYNRFEGSPCCGSDKLLTQFLRNNWGYKGLIVTDCWAVSDFYKKGYHNVYPGDPAKASAVAVLSGSDLECGDSFSALNEAAARGLIKESDIDEHLFRVLKARFALGEMDDNSIVSWNNIPESLLACDDHAEVALKMARETMTLLQNNGNVLPLKKEGVKYAVIGPNAADSTVLWGNYNGFPRHTITALEGIMDKVGKKNCIYLSGDKLLATPSGVDAYIYIGGISPALEGEEMDVKFEGFSGGDRTSIELPEIQRATLKILHETGKPVIFVNMSGSAVALSPEAESCDAILQAWYGGQAGGQAIADVLFGDYNPAGRLPVTFYASDSQLPDFHDYNLSGHTYRYFEGKPLFPFGYGLSYSKFNYGDATWAYNRKKAVLNLSVPVSNVSHVDGDEVVQVYLKRVADTEGPKMSLRGFKRISINAGTTATVDITLDAEALRTFNEVNGKMEIIPGEYIIYYGKSSDLNDLKKLNIKL